MELHPVRPQSGSHQQVSSPARATDFHSAWARYPTKSAKKDAQKAWGQVVTTPEIEAEIHAALDWQIPHWREMGWYHPPYFASYLRGERWTDQKPTANPTTASLPDWQRKSLGLVWKDRT